MLSFNVVCCLLKLFKSMLPKEQNVYLVIGETTLCLVM